MFSTMSIRNYVCMNLIEDIGMIAPFAFSFVLYMFLLSNYLRVSCIHYDSLFKLRQSDFRAHAPNFYTTIDSVNV